LGYKLNTVCVEFGLEYLIGAERDVNPTTENMPGKHQMDILAFSLGVGFEL